MAIITGLSGNEIYCLRLKGLVPGNLVMGNSVFSMGFMGGLASTGRLIAGGEVTQITAIVHEGRLEAYNRMMTEARGHGGTGVTAVTSELRNFHGRAEFLSIASCVSAESGHPNVIEFSTSANGQELYCQIDAGFRPIKFVFGNVAYSVGAVGGLMGSLKSLARGEIKEFSDVFNQTRHLALKRIVAEAVAVKANAVVGIETRIMDFKGAHEMLMLGTASHHPFLPADAAQNPVTSDLTNEEMWNLVALGYLPQKLVLGTAVYSLGVVGGLKAAFASFSRGEVTDLTSMIYDAREHALGLIKDEANAIGAEDVVGIKTYVHEHGSLLEFMAIGTAIRKVPGVSPLTASLPAQAIIRDKDTWVTKSAGGIGQTAGTATAAGD
jgi:uncharacterized protein YbjQ (UPF0145 family)